jgi:hypothetical protein
VLLNPRRYGAIVWRDHARFRLSVFSREEAAAIVSYLRWRADADRGGDDRRRIAVALEEFWVERARHAPTSAQLEAQIAEELAFQAALERDRSGHDR